MKDTKQGRFGLRMDFKEVSATEFTGVRVPRCAKAIAVLVQDLFQNLLEETMEKTENWATSAIKRQTEARFCRFRGSSSFVQDRKQRLSGKDNCHVM